MEAALTPRGLLALGVVVLALLLFIWNRVRADVVALGVMALLILTGLVTPQEGISGFANEATVTVALMLVLAAGLLRTGAVDVLGRWVGRAAGHSEARLLTVTVLAVLPLSALVNNTAAVAVLIPMLLGLSRAVDVAPSRLLMPLSFAGQLGGTLTLIGTSTNLLVAGLALELGLERIRLFDITPPAALICLVGVAYLLTIGRHLLPHRANEADLLESYELHDYLTALRVEPDSALVGRSLAETRFAQTLGLQVVRVRRNDGSAELPTGSTVVRAGDVLVVEGKIADIARVQDTEGVTLDDAEGALEPRLDISPPDDAAERSAADAVRLAEVLVPRRWGAPPQTVCDLGLRARYGVSAIAVRRHGVRLRDAIGRVRLQPGDLLLVQGTPDALRRLHEQSGLVLLGPVDLPETRRRKMKYAVPIMAGVVLLPALGVTTILVSALIGVVGMLVTRCITPDEAYREVDWMVIVLLAAMLPLGHAMHETGAAGFLAEWMATVTRPLGAHGSLAAFLVLATVLTSVISNAAAAVVLTPIAVAAAATLGLSPMPFVIGVMIGASNSFLSPVGYQTNAMIYGPGGYRFSDYLRVGAPLSLLLVAAATYAVPLFFPFA